METRGQYSGTKRQNGLTGQESRRPNNSRPWRMWNAHLHAVLCLAPAAWHLGPWRRPTQTCRGPLPCPRRLTSPAGSARRRAFAWPVTTPITVAEAALRCYLVPSTVRLPGRRCVAGVNGAAADKGHSWRPMPCVALCGGCSDVVGFVEYVFRNTYCRTKIWQSVVR